MLKNGNGRLSDDIIQEPYRARVRLMGRIGIIRAEIFYDFVDPGCDGYGIACEGV
jgi:hypothetical protein